MRRGSARSASRDRTDGEEEQATIKVKREDYATHEAFVEALAKDLADEVKEISEKKGIRPQYVVNKMFNVMYRETAKMDRSRRAKMN